MKTNLTVQIILLAKIQNIFVLKKENYFKDHQCLRSFNDQPKETLHYHFMITEETHQMIVQSG